MQCSVDGKTLIIPLHDDAVIVNQEINKENDTAIRTEHNTFTWCDASTKLFLNIYKEMNKLFKNRKIATKKMLWNKITVQMNSKRYNVSVIQVENKYKSLERSYKNMMSNNKKTGRGRMTCPYET